MDLPSSHMAPPPRASSPKAPPRSSSPKAPPRSSSPRAPPRSTTSRFCLDSSTLQQIESLVTSSPSPPRISQPMLSLPNMDISPPLTRGEVNDPVGAEEEDSLSQKLFERTESLLGRFHSSKKKETPGSREGSADSSHLGRLQSSKQKE